MSPQVKRASIARWGITALAGLAVVAGTLIGVASPASAAVSNASISPSTWNVGSSNTATLTWTESAVPTTIMARSPWPWPATYPSGTVATPITETATIVSTTVVRCPTTSIEFTSAQFNVTGAPTCNYINAPSSNWTGFWLSGGTLGMSAAPTITVTVPSGLVIAPSSARTDTWIVGPYSSNWNSGTQVEVTTYAVSSGGSGATVPMLTIDFDANGGSCKTAKIQGYYSTWGNAPKQGDCTRAGYLFWGYNTSANGTGTWIYPQGNINFTGDNRVYAIWKDPANLKAPGMPTNVVATAGWNKVTVSWAAPSDPGDFPITNYLVSSDPDRKSCITTALSYSGGPKDVNPLTCDFTNLTPGKNYTFTAQALNGNGWGERSSASNSVVPYNVKITKYNRKKLSIFQLLKSEVAVDVATPGVVPGSKLIPLVKVGSADFKAYAPIAANKSGTLTWSHKFERKQDGSPITVLFKLGENFSNQVVIPAVK